MIIAFCQFISNALATFVPDYIKSSAITDKLHDAFVQNAIVKLTLKNMPSTCYHADATWRGETGRMADPLQTRSSLCGLLFWIWVVLVKWYTCTYGNLQEKLGSSHPAFQDHSRSSELTQINLVCITPSFTNLEPTLYCFEDIAIYWFKTVTFSQRMSLKFCNGTWAQNN